jgi:cytochrome b6-f complex iron-sulfur subunit
LKKFNNKNIKTKKTESKHKPPKEESRRDFLKKLWKGLMAVAVFEFAAVFLGFLFSGKDNSSKTEPKQLAEAGTVESFQKNSVTAFRSGRFYLARLSDGGFLALSLRCTHLGCSINWEEDKKQFICPCHSSSFRIDGEVQNPPAPSALDYFPVLIENGIVKVDIGTKISRKRFDKSQVTYA